MAPLWSSQPFKAIYITYFLIKTPIHLIILFLQYYFIKSLRPLAEWNTSKCFWGALFRKSCQYAIATRTQRIGSINPKFVGERLTIITPPAAHVFSGPLAASESVKPAPVEALWFPSPPPQHAAELEKQRVVLHFPGGAFVLAYEPNGTGSSVAGIMSKHMRATRTVWAQPRLAGTPATHFPAAVQDAFTFYHHIVSLGVDPKNIILSGDSSGANVVLALMRYLEHSQTQLPLPGGAVVFSPWVHITASAGRDFERCKNSHFGFPTSSILQWGAEAYLPKAQLPAETEAYVSPLHHPFKTSIPLFIHAGAVEGFRESIESFADEMAGINDDAVRFHETAMAPHDLLIVHGPFGMTQDLEAVVQEACEFFEQ